MSTLFVGIDVSKDQLDVATYPKVASWSVSNNEAGFKTLVKRLRPLKPNRVILEATGGYEMSAAVALAEAKLPVAVVNPRQTRNFAKAAGLLAKTDRLDALALAHFAQAIKPKIRPLPDAKARELGAITVRRRQVVAMLTAEKNRRRPDAPKRMQKELDKHVAWLEKALLRLNAELEKMIRNSPIWRDKDDLLQGVRGIGPKTSALLISEMPELGKLNGKKIGKLAGLAPMNCDSGRYRGERHIQGGRAVVRSALYMATLTAIRCNPVIAAFYKHLRAKGKKFKVAITACMRKLLVRINAMIRDGVPWQDNPTQNA